MVVAEVFPGPCKFKAMIKASRISNRTVRIKIESQCKHVKLLGDLLSEVDINECIRNFDDDLVLNLSKSIIPHASCIIPVAILKCIEIETGLALKENASIEFK